MAVAVDNCRRCYTTIAGTAKFCAQCGYQLDGVVYAGFWIRFVAYTIDGVILGVVLIVVAVAAAATGAVGFLSYWAIAIAYVVGSWMRSHATPGKRLVGVRIVTVSGEPLRFGKSLLRYICHPLVWGLPAAISATWISASLGFVGFILLLPLYFLPWIAIIGYLMIAFRGDKRGLHDLIAGTMVVKT